MIKYSIKANRIRNRYIVILNVTENEENEYSEEYPQNIHFLATDKI